MKHFMIDDDLDAMMSDEFLDGLEDIENLGEAESSYIARPEWVSEDTEHTTFKAWDSILKLKSGKEQSIKSYGKVADGKTLKGIYQITKSEVASLVGITSQSIFRASKFSDNIRKFFGDVNIELLELHDKEQKKQKARSKNTGVRTRKKNVLVNDVQSLSKSVQDLEARLVKDTLDLLLQEMPIDLKRKLRV
jgi:hypothetical protein